MKRKVRKVGKYLVVDPRVCFGRLTFRGTRVPVETVMTFISMGDSVDEILEGWPELKREAVVEAIKLASEALVEKSGAKRLFPDELARTGRSA